MHEAKPRFFIYENNKSMSKAIRESITETFGFEPICINSALVSAQNRQRLYWVGIRQEDGSYKKADIQQPEDKGIMLKDILETGMAWQQKSYTVTATEYNGSSVNHNLEKHIRTMVAEPVPEYCGTIQAPIYEVKDGMITVKGKQYPIKLVDGYYIIRKLTVRECMRLQTIPEWYEFPVSNSQAYKMLGNGWTVEVIAHILKSIKTADGKE